MKVKKLLMVFVLAFTLAVAGGSVLATNAYAHSGTCGLAMSWLNPSNWHLSSLFTCSHTAPQPARAGQSGTGH